MIRTKEIKKRKLKSNKGIAMVSLIITIVLMLIISSTTVYVSYERFEINKLKKMYNDMEILSDKVENYYLKYDGLPIVRDENNAPIEYTYTSLDSFLGFLFVFQFVIHQFDLFLKQISLI